MKQKTELACNHCGKKPSWKEDTGISKKLLEGSIHGYVAWQETDKATGKVDKDFIEVICDPIIAPKKTVIVAAVNPKT